MKIRKLLGSITVAVLAAGLMFSTGSPAQAATCGTLLPLAVPACGALWGIAVPGGSAKTLASDEAKVGRTFDIVYDFHQIGDPLPTPDEVSEVASGHLLHVNIESTNYASVASGAQDAALTRQALGVASLKAPVYVTFSHEPDVKSKASRGTPAQYVAAWRHVHDLFIANGATNAVWVWVMVGWYPNFPGYAGFYPGNGYVDWISWEGYSRTGCSTARNPLTSTFADSVGPMYQWLHDGHGAAAGIDISKPEMISEYDAQYDTGNPGAQGAWLQAIPQLLKTQFPDIKAVAKWDNQGGNCRYDLAESPLTLAGFTAAGQDPYVNQLTPVSGQPHAAFTPSCSADTCTFDASASTAPGSSISSYAWDFGDGTAGSGVNPSHTYAADGTYQVTLTVQDASGNTDAATQTVTVTTAPAPQVAFVAGAATTGNATSETVKIPAAVKSGNALLLLATGAGPGVLTAPAGWTKVDTASLSSLSSTVWERVATATDAGTSVAVKFPGIEHGTVQLLAYSGTDPANPVPAYARSALAKTATSFTSPTTTVPAAGDVTVTYWACKSSTVSSWKVPAGQTVRSTAYGSGGGRITSVATDAGPGSAGATGGLTASPNVAATAFAAWTIVVG